MLDLLELAVTWATEMSSKGQAAGRVLSGPEARLAAAVGVERPDLVRLVLVNQIPLPSDTTLRAYALAHGFDSMEGLTLDRSVFVVDGCLSVTLCRHEFRHVAQYEQFGSIRAFLQEYLAQLEMYGYESAPLEIDARMHEHEDAR